MVNWFRNSELYKIRVCVFSPIFLFFAIVYLLVFLLHQKCYSFNCTKYYPAIFFSSYWVKDRNFSTVEAPMASFSLTVICCLDITVFPSKSLLFRVKAGNPARLTRICKVIISLINSFTVSSFAFLAGCDRLSASENPSTVFYKI